MLDAIKGKLQSVQSDISEGLRQLRKKRPLSQRGLSSNVSFHLEFINADAGAELLHNYSEAWHRIHHSNAENADLARRVDADLRTLATLAEHKANEITDLQRELRQLSVVSDELSNLITETAKLEGLCEEMESALAYLDVLCHTEDSQSIKLDQRFQLALYRERKMAELNDAKAEMALEYTRETERLDRRRLQQHADKLKILQDAAEKDINTFKTSGVITNSLAEMVCDQRPKCLSTSDDDGVVLASYSPLVGSEDLHALEEFLSDAKLDDSGIVGDPCNPMGSAEISDQDSNGNEKH